MNELQELKTDLLEMRGKLLDAIVEYGKYIDDQRSHIDSLVSDAEKLELYTQVENTIEKIKNTSTTPKTPKYF